MSEVVTTSVDCEAHIDKLRASAKASVTCVYGQSLNIFSKQNLIILKYI